MSGELATWLPMPAGGVALREHEVHVWRAGLQQPQIIFDKLYAVLSDEERSRAERFRCAASRRRFIVARGVLRKILSRYLGAQADELRFAYEVHGKPRLLSEQLLSFNLSHAEDMALYAITPTAEIGVDVEYLLREVAVDKIAKRFFSTQETSTLLALPESQRTEAFFNCWTRKEAFLKAIGEGLSHPLNRFDVSLAPGEPAVLLATRPDLQEVNKWAMFALNPGGDYIGALAVADRLASVQCWHWQDV